MEQIIERLVIAPSFARGFTFSWAVALECSDPAPWTFQVEQGHTQDGPWEPLSPVLTHQYSYQHTGKVLVPKDPVLYFRVVMTTPVGTYHSAVRSPFGDLNRADFLQGREIMRNEVVQARLKAGVLCKLWMKAVFGPKCDKCVDPITGTVNNPDCPACFGTGIQPGYYGPFDMWAVFSPRKRDKGLKGDGLGVHEDYAFSVRAIGSLVVKKDDVLVDVSSDRRYYINSVENVMELRRIPLIQQFEAREAPTSEQIYRLP